MLHGESVSFGVDVKFPESGHAPVVVEFELPEDQHWMFESRVIMALD